MVADSASGVSHLLTLSLVNRASRLELAPNCEIQGGRFPYPSRDRSPAKRGSPRAWHAACDVVEGSRRHGCQGIEILGISPV